MGRPFVLEEEEPVITITTIKESDDNKKLPSLFFLGELSGETKHAFFDPIQLTFNIVEFPELGCQTECISSGHGWLLILSRTTSSLFFFNPLSRQRIDLPYRSSVFNAVAFSAPPTSPNCIVFAIEKDSFNGKFHIDALRVGKERVWTRYAYLMGTSEFAIIMHVIFGNGILYLVDSRGRIGNFDITNGNWKIISGKVLMRVSYLVEFNGEIFGIKKENYGAIGSVYKLKFENEIATWEEVKDIGDIIMFLGPYGSCASASLNDELKNKIFVTRDDPASKCVIYDFDIDGNDYKKTKRFDATSFSWWYAPIWIERSS